LIEIGAFLPFNHAVVLLIRGKVLTMTRLVALALPARSGPQVTRTAHSRADQRHDGVALRQGLVDDKPAGSACGAQHQNFHFKSSEFVQVDWRYRGVQPFAHWAAATRPLLWRLYYPTTHRNPRSQFSRSSLVHLSLHEAGSRRNRQRKAE
jgi:hypothetical protein